MANRDQIHLRISDLLETLNINNNRLSLHAEELSDLDVLVMRKQCIDLYEQINLLTDYRGDTPKTEVEVGEHKIEPPQQKPKEVEIEETVEKIKESVSEENLEIKTEKIDKSAKAKDPEVRSIHMKHQDEAEMVSLFEKFNSKPISTISEAITISKRFEFQNNFFDGDAANYKEFIHKIDDAGDREAAFAIYHDYKKRLAWDNEDLKDELKSLLYRKYIT